MTHGRILNGSKIYSQFHLNLAKLIDSTQLKIIFILNIYLKFSNVAKVIRFNIH